MRGVKKEGEMTTIVTTGLFRKERGLEEKFISLIR
jgi:GTP cyclohydrolase I